MSYNPRSSGGYSADQLLQVVLMRSQLPHGPMRQEANRIVHAYDVPGAKWHAPHNPYSTVPAGVHDPRVDVAIRQMQMSLKK